jgi:hypothetical protein
MIFKFKVDCTDTIIKPWKKLDAWASPFHKLQAKTQNKFKDEDLGASGIQPA